MKLFTFFQSGSAYRVRIALALKGIEMAHPAFAETAPRKQPDNPDNR